MTLQVRKMTVAGETTFWEGGRVLDRPLTRASAAAVIKNPYAGEYSEDLSLLVDGSVELANELATQAVSRLDRPVQSYGKGAIVGIDGELEHAAALLHPKLGKPFRDAVGGGKAIIPSAKKMGVAGVALDIPLHYKDAAFVRSHFDAMEVRVSGAPRPDEIVVIVVVTDGGRPHPRVGGLTVEESVGSDGLR